MDKTRILLVDDEEGFTRLVKMNLEETGAFDVHIVNRGKQAFEVACTFKPHLILLDVVMPDMDGLSVVAHFRSSEELKAIPVVFLTATISSEAGVDGNGFIGGHPVLAKPVSGKKLISIIEQYTNK